MLFFNQKTNVIGKALRTIVPMYNSVVAKKKTMCVTNYMIDKNFFVECRSIYGLFVLRYNYGVNRYLSELFIFTGGLHRRTAYYFFSDLFDLVNITYIYSAINKIAFTLSKNSLKKKFAQHTF